MYLGEWIKGNSFIQQALLNTWYKLGINLVFWVLQRTIKSRGHCPYLRLDAHHLHL